MNITIATVNLLLGILQVQFIIATYAVSPDPEVTCDSCCQGPAGIPGIPGSNGNHGQHGTAGPRGDAGSPGEVGQPGAKGDMGSDGLVGEPGAKGENGLKGDQGVGQPGKQGLPGMNGVKGERGEPGPAGKSGEAGECSTRRPAFTAVRNTAYSPQSSYDPLLFDELLFSEEGTDFNLSNGTFTCTVPGTYVFMFSAQKTHNTSVLYVRLMKNGLNVVIGLVNDAGYHQVSGSAVIPLQYGDQVHVALQGSVYSTHNHYTSFTGFML